MLSKLQFDLNENNAPILRVIVSSSDDLRDKVAKRFIEGFQASSNFCKISFDEVDSRSISAIIEPLKEKELEYAIKDYLLSRAKDSDMFDLINSLF